ncbi:hypothetical protein ScPMuIL_008880 [Solemya velum]
MESVEYIRDLLKESVPVSVAIVIGACYSLYYLLYIVKKPLVACNDKKLQSFLNKYCPSLKEKYWPTFWCFEARAQTVLRTIIKSFPKVKYESETLVTPDGGEIKLDWYQNNNDVYPEEATRPTIVMLPGLTGRFNQSYILHFVQEAARLNYRSVVFNNRGNGGSQLLTARTYCAANTEDLELVVSHLKQKYPGAPVIGVGVSLGGMILFNYLAKTGENCGLVAGMCISVAWNVFESVLELEKPVNKFLLNRTLAKNLVDNVKKNIDLFENHFDMEHVLKSRTIREFDERFTCRVFGYPSWQEYYKDACLHDKVHALEIPVLCLSAADDPFSPMHAIPIEDAMCNDNIAIVVPSHGGHIGFLEGLFPRQQGYMDRLFSEFVNGIFTYGTTALKKD